MSEWRLILLARRAPFNHGVLGSIPSALTKRNQVLKCFPENCDWESGREVAALGGGKRPCGSLSKNGAEPKASNLSTLRGALCVSARGHFARGVNDGSRPPGLDGSIRSSAWGTAYGANCHVFGAR
jgi:hypothetical protein